MKRMGVVVAQIHLTIAPKTMRVDGAEAAVL
jgi:hypothetical protein